MLPLTRYIHANADPWATAREPQRRARDIAFLDWLRVAHVDHLRKALIVERVQWKRVALERSIAKRS